MPEQLFLQLERVVRKEQVGTFCEARNLLSLDLLGALQVKYPVIILPKDRYSALKLLLLHATEQT